MKGKRKTVSYIAVILLLLGMVGFLLAGCGEDASQTPTEPDTVVEPVTEEQQPELVTDPAAEPEQQTEETDEQQGANAAKEDQSSEKTETTEKTAADKTPDAAQSKDPATDKQDSGKTAATTKPAATSNSQKPAASTSSQTPATPAATAEQQTQTTAPATDANGNPKPVEPETVTVGDTAYTCTLSVTCKTLLDKLDQLEEGKADLVPADGVIFPEQKVTFYEGESVFNVLQRELKKSKIHLEFVNTPAYNSVYVEGINNLYEFDGGDLSGWLYKVNDWFPNYGCSRYQLQDGDVIEWIYTCDLGRDVGGYVNGVER